MEKFVFNFQGKTLEQLKEFANMADRTEGGVTISYGKNHFDGSSFMSLIALKDCNFLIAFYSEKEVKFREFMIKNYFKNLPICNKNYGRNYI